VYVGDGQQSGETRASFYAPTADPRSTFEAAEVAEVSLDLLLNCNGSVPSILAALIGCAVLVCHLFTSGCIVLSLHIFGTRLPLQVAALFDWAASLSDFAGAEGWVEVMGAVEVVLCSTVWDVLGKWMLTTNLGYAGIRGFTSFGESVITAIEVLAFLSHDVSAL